MNDRRDLNAYVKAGVHAQTTSWYYAEFTIENNVVLQYIPRLKMFVLCKGEYCVGEYHVKDYANYLQLADEIWERYCYCRWHSSERV